MAETKQQKLAREMSHKVGAVDQSARDKPLTGSALQALARGWAAGTAGLPGDIEGLARTVDKYTTLNPDLRAAKSTESVLPTSDFYKEWLPGKQVGDENIAAVGSLFGGVGATKPVSMAKGALSKIAEAAPGPIAGSLTAQRGIIKAPGGNWLSRGDGAHPDVGSPERLLAGLHVPYPNVNADAVAKQMGVTTQELLDSGLFRRGYGAMNTPNGVVDLNKSIQAINAGTPQHALNNFVDKQLTRYVKNDMATERDPIRALAEKGPIHIPVGLHQWVPEALGVRRMNAGFPAHGVGQSDAAKGWEIATDGVVDAAKASEYTKPLSKNEWNQGLRSMVTDANSWLEKVDPNTTIHAAQGTSEELGFSHLIDELRNAVDPNSGLPAHLMLDVKSLDRVSVPQAVERVAAINAWRAAQKVEANSKLANNAATHVFKEYAENNPKGLKWVELKQPAKAPEGWVEQVKDGGGANLDPNHAYGRPLLEQALKYEGDAMGHCVGGYCDDVANGSSRIYSLRDAKGQPHVTIETSPSGSNKISDMNAGTPTDYRVVQIKGKGNKKPNDEYLPFVQDFVKSGKWSDVGDLQNSGLIHADSPIPWPANYGIEDVDKVKSGLGGYSLRKHLEEIDSKYTTPEAFHSWLGTKGYAEGGGVYTIGGPDGATYGTPEPEAAQPLMTREQFLAKVTPGMLDGEGKFKAPKDGVNYMLAGMTPEDAYNTAQGMTEWSEDNRQGKPMARQQAEALLDPAWRTGPNNGGGFLGGIGNAAQGIFDGVRTNPAIMAALTAGAGQYINGGLQGMGVSPAMAKTLTPIVSSAGKTLIGGGNLTDIAKNAGASYIGGEVGSAVKDTSGFDWAGKAANTITQSAIKGNLSESTIDGLATQYAAGEITDLTGIPPQTASIIVNLARKKKVSPVGAFTQIAGAVGAPKRSGTSV